MWWSADNQSIVFQQKGELREIGVAASESRLIARLPPEATVNAVAWGAQGAVLVALNSSPLHIVRAGSATLEPVAPLDTAVGELEQLGPVFLPDGRRYLYSSVRRDANRYVTRLRSLDTDAVQDFAGIDERVIWAGDNQVVLTSGTALLAQAVSYNPPSLVGSPVQLASNVGLNPRARSSQAAVSGSTLVYRSERVVARQFTWLARDGHSLGALGPAGAYTTFSLSDDGARVVLTRIEGSAQNIWVMDAAKGTLNRVTAGPDVDVDPRLSPDGRTVMFGSFRDPVRSPYTATVAGSEPKRLFAFKGRLFALDDWSADGKWLLYHGSTIPRILAARLDQLAAEPVVVASALTGSVDQAVMSNDGRWVAYNSTESGQAEVYVVPFPPTGDKWQVSVGGGAQPLWRRDGGELYYLKLDGTLMAVGISTRPKFEAANPTALFRTPLSNVAQVIEQYAVAPDGKRFLFAQAVGDATAAPMTVLTNWRSLLKPSGPTQ